MIPWWPRRRPRRLAEVERGLDAITFASPSSVRNFLKVTAQMERPGDVSTVVACIGPSTAAEAAEHGLRGRLSWPNNTPATA